MERTRLVALGLLCGMNLLGYSSSASAQAASGTVRSHAANHPTLRVSLSYAVRRASKASPELAPTRAARRASQRSRRASRTTFSYPPVLELSVGPRLGTDQGFDASAGLWQDIPLAGVAKSRQRYADARALSARFQLQDAQLQAALSAGLAWVDARVARRLLGIRKRGQRSAKQLVRYTRARQNAGAATRGEVALAQSLLGSADAAVLDAEGLRFSADLRLAYALGLERQRRLVVVGRVDRDGARLTEEEVLASLRHAPSIAKLRADERAARSAAQRARAEGAPRLSVGPSVTREATGSWIVLGRVSVPLPTVNSRALDTAESLRKSAETRAVGRRAIKRLKRDVHLLFHEHDHAKKTRNALKTSAVAPALQAHREALKQYAAGKIDLNRASSTHRNLLDAQERWLLAAGAARAAEIRLLAVSGRLVRAAAQRSAN